MPVRVPVGLSAPTPTVSDPSVERLRELQLWQIAYCRDVVRPLTPGLIERGGLAKGGIMVGRAYTCYGPDIYLNALEGIQPGEVYVQAGCHATDAVFSPGWTHAYLRVRGAVGAVVDGGVYKSFECSNASCPIFSRFTSPSVAINRRFTPSVRQPIDMDGVRIAPGDIICGDADGVLVIPKECEADLMAGLDGYLLGNGMFGKVAARGLADGIPMTQQPAIADMFERKYAHPDSYWRQYEPWWNSWKAKFPGLNEQSEEGSNAFYSGRTKSKL